MIFLNQHQQQKTSPGNVAGCAQHRSTRKHQEYAIFAIGMCVLPIPLKWECSHVLIVSEILNTATKLRMSETRYEIQYEAVFQ